MSGDLQSFLNSRNSFTSYEGLLANVQNYMSVTYESLLSNELSNDDAELVKKYIGQYLTSNSVKFEEYSDDELTERLFSDMAEFSF